MNTQPNSYDGYVSDITYINSYFMQLAPNYLNALVLFQGYRPPTSKKGEPLRYLELGFGQGLSLNVHTACNQEIEFWGTDFLLEQTQHAQALSDKAKLGNHLLNDSFEVIEEKARQNQLPQFDYIVLHGIWSWINEPNRNHILRIINLLLKEGGLVYINYNSLPGRIDQWPLQKLLTLHAKRKTNGNSYVKAQKAAQFTSSLVNAKAHYFVENHYEGLIKNLCQKDPTYLAHEYLNENWNNFYFKTVADKLKQQGCEYVTSTHFFQSLKETQPQETVRFIEEIDNPLDREALFDFNFFRGFRTDIFMKNPEQLTFDDPLFDQLKFIATTTNTSKKNLEARYAATEIMLEEDIYRPLLMYLSEHNYKPKSFRDFQKRHESLGYTPNQLFFHLKSLFFARYTLPYIENISDKTRQASQRLNRIFCEKTRLGHDQTILVSPHLGLGFSVPYLNQLFLLAISNGTKNANDLAKFAQASLQNNKKVLSIKTPSGVKKGIEGLKHAAYHFEKMLPFYRLLGLLL